MKKYLFFLLILIVANCSSSKKITNKKNAKQDPILVELTLDEKPENFVWKKGDFLDLRGKITNKSKVPISILGPKTSYQVSPDYFSVNFIKEIEDNFCSAEITEDITRRKLNEFVTILPNRSLDIYISGRSYLIEYCNNENQTTEEVKLKLTYYAKDNHYTPESYFIANTYKVKLNDNDKQFIQYRINRAKNSSMMKKLSEEKRNEQLKRMEQSLRKRIINSTPEEQRVMIEKFNALYHKKLESNTITIKVQK